MNENEEHIQKTSADISGIRRKLAGRDIILMPYCHADIAWNQTRSWHINRYMKVLEDVLALAEEHPDVTWFMDSYIEFIQPVFAARPDYIPKFARLLKQGRVALCCGHYGNLRMTNMGNEIILRNILYGRRRTARLFPDADLSVYANLDVTIGHTQVPQILRLAGIESYFAWRPEMVLDKQGCPRTFVWRGISGDQVIVRRHPYMDSLSHFLTKDRTTWRAVWPEVVNHLWGCHLEPQVADGVKTISMNIGMDDCRPLRTFPEDRPQDISGLIKEWNRSETSRMRFGTPNDVFAALKMEKSALPVVDKVLDQTEICFNMAEGGGNGLWRLRELSDRVLTEAEWFATLSSALCEYTYPAKALLRLWEDLLSCCPHCIQYLEYNDYHERRLMLENCVAGGNGIRKSALRSLFGAPLAIHADGLLIVNPLPFDRKEVFEITYPNTDLQLHNVSFIDDKGRKMRSQLVERGGHNRAAEFTVLLNADVCAGGYVYLKPRHEKAGLEVAEPKPIAGMTVVVRTDPLTVCFDKGHIVKIRDGKNRSVLSARPGNGFLEPVHLPYKGTMWPLSAVTDTPVTFTPESLAIVEQGPLRWRLIRKGKAGIHSFTQRIDIIAGQKTIEVETEFFAAPDVTHIGLAIPVEDKASLTVDIPFGIERRDVDNVPYGPYSESIETWLPGMFWGRQWVKADYGKTSVTLLCRDGDRYYWRDKKGKRVVHIMAKIRRKPDEGWESKLKCGTEPGYHRFHHVLVINDASRDCIDLVKKAQAYNHPFFWTPVDKPETSRRSALELQPASVLLSALYREGRNVLLRIHQSGNYSVNADIRLPFAPQEAIAVNLEGTRLAVPVRVVGNRIRVRLNKWQIMTLRMSG